MAEDAATTGKNGEKKYEYPSNQNALVGLKKNNATWGGEKGTDGTEPGDEAWPRSATYGVGSLKKCTSLRQGKKEEEPVQSGED